MSETDTGYPPEDASNPQAQEEGEESLADYPGRPTTALERMLGGPHSASVTGGAQEDQAAFESRKKGLMRAARSQEGQSSRTPDRAPARRQGR